MTELTGTVTCSYVYLHTNMVTPGSSQIHSVALHNSSYVHSHAHRFLYSNIFTLLQDHLHNKITGSVLRYILKCIHVINAGDASLIPESERSLEEGMATHSSILAWENPIGRGAWLVTVYGVAKSWIQLSTSIYFAIN